MWIRLVFIMLTVTQLYGSRGQWSGKSVHPVKIFKTDQKKETVLEVPPIEPTNKPSPLGRDTKKACVVVGTIATVVCYKLLVRAMQENS